MTVSQIPKKSAKNPVKLAFAHLPFGVVITNLGQVPRHENRALFERNSLRLTCGCPQDVPVLCGDPPPRASAVARYKCTR